MNGWYIESGVCCLLLLVFLVHHFLDSAHFLSLDALVELLKEKEQSWQDGRDATRVSSPEGEP